MIREIDNTVATLKPITWQFDRATNLIGMMSAFKAFFESSTTSFWDLYAKYIFDIDFVGTDNDPFSGLGLLFIGSYLGVPRPVVVIDGASTPISNDLYRKLLKAYAHALHANRSADEINRFLTTVFGRGKVILTDGFDMTITFTDNGLEGEDKALFEQHHDLVCLYPCGVRLNTAKQAPGVLGLQFTQDDGQMQANFAASEDQNNGGAFVNSSGIEGGGVS